ncbi:MAG: hypothetical protein R2681_05865 [Pyrinomonadaceae bacterium]
MRNLRGLKKTAKIQTFSVIPLFVLGALLTSALYAQSVEQPVFGASERGIVSDRASEKTESAEKNVNENEFPVKKQSSTYARPTAKKRFKRYLNSTIGPFSIAKQAASAGYSTYTNSPEEWGKNGSGFTRRFASNLGKNAINKTTVYALDEAFELDSHFYRSKNRSFGSKIKNAFLSPVTARNKSGKRVIGIPRLAGAYGSAVIARETWYPDRYSYKDGVRDATISLGVGAAVNLFKEFFWK